MKSQAQDTLELYQFIGPFATNVTLRTLFGVNDAALSQDIFKNATIIEQCLALQRRGTSADSDTTEAVHTAARAALKLNLKEVFVRLLRDRGMALPEFMKNHKFDAPLPLTLSRTFLNAFAGVATTLTWAMMILCEKQTLQTSLYDVIGGARDHGHNALIRATLLECLRLYPTAWMMTRKATRTQKIDAFTLQPGDDVHVCMYSLHRDPTYWHNPTEFDQQRFINSSHGMAKDAFAYLPFGAGPHRCVGEKFAMLMMSVTLGELIKNFHWQSSNLNDATPFPFVALRPIPGAHVSIAERMPHA